MKKILMITLAFQLTLSSGLGNFARAQSQPEMDTRTSQFEKDLKTAVYSVREIPAIVKDLGGMDTAAGRAMTETVMKDIYLRFDTALSLISVIYQDSKLSESQKFDLTNDVAAELGTVLLTVLRQQGLDKVDQDKLLKRLSEMATLEHAKLFLQEFVFDATLLMRSRSAEFQDKADAQKLAPGATPTLRDRQSKYVYVWNLEERANRQKLSQEMLERLQDYAREVYPKLADGKLESADRGSWAEHSLDIGLRLREARLRAEKATAATYLGFALWGLMAPHVDMVGLIAGRDGFSLFMSGVMYASFWTTVGLVKWNVTSSKVVASLKKTIETFKASDAALLAQGEAGSISSVGKLTLRQKLQALSSRVTLFCRQLLGR
ncbi:MAG: hypothetical protein ACK5Y2_08330 [Bdellovibrionales bacterium]